ncbi:1,4-alpha-glucan-branching enzyme 3, chloroplastic/amyloplastic [Castilleja foliolosa]|uniref:1,4-alpha-glucan branching enzyme n=1 Tax=Castilleja foliolosa TaxID=1961234 RepID=A0ABD3DTB3_9LAMI
MISLTQPLQFSLNSPFSKSNYTCGRVFFPPNTRNNVIYRAKCSAADNRQPQPQAPPKQQQNQNSERPRKKNQQLDADKIDGVDPVGFLDKHGITSKAFAQFLRERHKALKDLKDELLNRHLNLHELASGFEILGMHRNVQHRVDYMDWAPGARYCSLVGDFNRWSPTENSAREGHLGHDDYGYWFIIIDDKLREGEEPDEVYFQQYNYVDEYDKGDSGVTVEEIFKKANDEYWEPGEDRFIKSRYELAAKLYEQVFGPNGPQMEEELEEIADPETRYKAWKEQHKDDPPSNLPPCDVIDDGKERDEFEVVMDPAWQEKFKSKKPPIAYWLETRKGRKAWLKKYRPGLPHGSKYRVYFNTPMGPLERVPAWATYVIPEADGNQSFAIHWEPTPESAYSWKHKHPPKPKSMRIYECHVGISGKGKGVASFNEFTDNVLSHVKEAGYNAIQLIGVPEHKDYFTFGYRVTNFFAVSSRFGTPEDFKRLVDEAHGLGLLVLLDIVHSYAAADEMVGLSFFDGANDCYFHSDHDVWMVEYQIDGFYFHSLGSMIYTHNGFATFTGDMEEYCNQYVDREALLYIMLANEILHEIHPNIVTIAEDATVYPGLCEPTSQGGLGFDYFVNLSASELWLSFLEKVPDQEWSMNKLVSTLIGNRCNADKMLLYAENHNQSISGGRSFAEILFGSSKSDEALLRGSSLHKMIRLITFTIGGPAYLNFMGNEFGHPKRVEFPMSTNKFSYSLANRNWDLLKDEFHNNLFAFDKDMMKLDLDGKILLRGSRGLPKIHHINDETMVISYLRGPFLLVFNFHPTNSYERYSIGVEEAGEYQIALNTDEDIYGGRGLIGKDQYTQRTISRRTDGARFCLELPLPSRTAQVYKLTRILRV